MRLIDKVVLDSKDRILNSSTSSTVFKIAFPKSESDANIFEISSVILPYTFDTVDASNNVFRIGAVAYTIPVGHYDIDTLVTAINTLIVGVGTIVKGSNDKYILTLLAAATFTPGIASNLLGYINQIYPINTVFTAIYFPRLTEDSDYLTLHSSYLTDNSKESHSHSDNRSNILCTIPLTEPFGNIIVYEPQQRLLFSIDRKRDIHEIDFGLYDQGGNPINLGTSSFSINVTRYKSF